MAVAPAALPVTAPVFDTGSRHPAARPAARLQVGIVSRHLQWTGDGLVDFKARFQLLTSGGFNGPVNIHFEHHGLLGSDLGTWKLTMTRAEFQAIIKQDLDRLREAMPVAQVL